MKAIEKKIQPNNSLTNPLFLHLLSAAIWNKPADAALFVGLNADTWDGIADMARRQAVSALIADKALSLPKESLPPMKLKLQFLVMIQQTEALNRKMIQVLKDLSQEYQEADFPFCLLKGLSNGVNYPSPLLRNAGDIDLWLYQEGDYEKSKDWISGKGIDIVDGHHMHYAFKKDNVYIENHTRFTYYDNKKYDNLLRKQEEEIIKENNFCKIKIDGLSVQQLPIEINALFIFQHMFRHFVHGGIGFRQFCDWLLFLSKYRDEIDVLSFTALAQSYALFYPMQVFARAAVNYLGASESIFPFDMISDNKHAELATADILQSGNFGFHRQGNKRPKEKLLSMWFTYKTILRRSKKFGEISPEHIKILLSSAVFNRLKIGFK